VRTVTRPAKAGESVYELYAQAHGAYLRRAREAFEVGLPLPEAPKMLADPEAWGLAFDVPPPRVTYLAPLLFDLPPLVPRAEIGRSVLVGVISEGSVRRDMDRGRGPRVHIRGNSRFGVYIPAPFLVEYLESKGKKIVTEQL